MTRTYCYVVRRGKPCGHEHTSERELANCWRKRGELWASGGGSVWPITEAGQLARIRAFVPRAVRGRPPKQTPLIAPASPLHVKGLNVQQVATYRAAAAARGYASLSDYVRALLDADAAALGAPLSSDDGAVA